MADKDAAPTFNPKHRILGAVIVVSLAVILVPIILDRHEPPNELKNPSATTGEAKPGETRVVVTPVAELGATPARPANQPVANPAPPVVAAKPVADPVPAAAKPAAEPIPAKPAESTEPVAEEPAKKTATKAATKTDTKKKTEKLKKGWVVQVGVYSNTENAKRMVAKLKDLGVKVKSETITLSGSKATRLRVGPYADRATAEKQQARIQKDIGEKVSVVAWP